ncbi:response regulator transcription factor [Parasphaerochaeta coccoides]|uniref:Two component transcriptional regulator, winged helix family n=1 Tax=Parasphaerochaeta coccoides (strain ATCC BAA-1237 / DSM 17374 / SPN1) TaxID=760011 RepID=F4GHN8_PARC1|nr:response regulator transcription factor [Parasphaerochaeta coccoides]AEC01576.1 two component transcriptional regulator, winged helix family [Parasphaerochaeta coccoides DSM 17374]
MKQIYLADEQEMDRLGIRQFLELSEYSVHEFNDLHSLQLSISRQLPDLLILAITFSDGDGFSFLKKLRATYSFPVIFVTSRGAESDRILGFELGADDYVVKPFSAKELVLRVRAIFRRLEGTTQLNRGGSSWVLDGSVLLLDEVSHLFTIDGDLIPLTAAEWRIMSYLVSNAGILITRAQVLENCFDYSFEFYDRIVDTHIKNIRSKLGALGSQWIETVRGYGYRFAGRPTDGRPTHGNVEGKSSEAAFASHEVIAARS